MGGKKGSLRQPMLIWTECDNWGGQTTAKLRGVPTQCTFVRSGIHTCNDNTDPDKKQNYWHRGMNIHAKTSKVQWIAEFEHLTPILEIGSGQVADCRSERQKCQTG